MKKVSLTDPNFQDLMTQGNSRISEKNLGKDPALIVWQKPKVLNQTHDSVQ